MNILPFEFEKNRIRTFVDEKDNIWFNAKDILVILLDKKTPNVGQATKDLEDDEKRSFKMTSSATGQSEFFVSESGLYALIMRSRKPIAKPFQKWVTREVLPEIRKTGSYSLQNSQSPQTEENDPITKRTQLIENAGKQFKVFKEIFQDIGITDKTELAITTNRAVKNETEIDFIALSGKNGLEVEEKFFTVTELCELIRESEDFPDEIKLSVSTKNNLKPQPINLNKILESHGFQVKIDKQWKPTKTGEKFSKFVQNKSTTSTKNIFHLNWKIEILEEIF
jgi:prophage antirepressor-like protein